MGVFGDFFKALGQIGDPRFRKVVGLGLLLALALLAATYGAVLWLIEAMAPGSVEIPLVGPVSGLDTLLSWGSLVLMLVLSVFLMIPVASAFASLFLEDVAQAVEDRHYPGLAPVARIPALQSVLDSVNFFGVVVVVNLFGLLLYVFAGPFVPLAFWALNGWLLGREYFALVAMRRMSRAEMRDMRRDHRWEVWLGGALMAAPLSVPIVNLVIPVLGVATFTHLYHRLARTGRGSAQMRPPAPVPPAPPILPSDVPKVAPGRRFEP